MQRKACLTALLLLAACARTDTEWARLDTAAAQRDSDQRQCQQIADYQAFDESFGGTAKYPPFRDTQFLTGGGGDDGGGGLTVSYSQRGPRIYELAEYCMEQRGYSLRRLPQ